MDLGRLEVGFRAALRGAGFGVLFSQGFTWAILVAPLR